jgi:hypothetical protein
MIGKRLTWMSATAALLALGAVVAGMGMARQGDSSETKEVCCFNNPAYSGTCRVEPAEGETCGSILAYLNNPMSQGKNYCGGTKVRQGWQQVKCEDEASEF